MKMKSMKLVGLMLLVILLSVGLGCNSSRVTNGATDIRGNIASISRADPGSREKGTLGSVLIEGVKERDTEFDKALITISKKTRIFEQAGGSRRQGTFEALKVGQKVEARFTGPVMESYPVQATATEVVILK